MLPGVEGRQGKQIYIQPAETKPNAPFDIIHEIGSSEFYAEFANLGGDGTAFVFIDRTQDPPAVQWYYNR